LFLLLLLLITVEVGAFLQYDEAMKKPTFKADGVLARLVQKEQKRQKNTINLIASENIAPAGVQELLGSVFVNKYCEGYPNKRYYAGCDVCDDVELLAQQRARDVFGLKKQWHVNVQAYSGAIANLAIFLGLAGPGGKILSMNLFSGGHLSHGSRVSFSGKLFSVRHYGVDDEYAIDYGALEKLAKKYKPTIIVSGASAYPKKIDFKKIGTIAKKVGAYHLADISHVAGLVAGGAYSSPFAHADVVMSTTHKSLLGPRGALVFANTRSAVTKKRGVVIGDVLNKALFPGLQGGPHMHTIAAIAHGLFLVDSAGFKTYTRRVVANARALVVALKNLGFPIIGRGTDSHMVLVDVSFLGIDGAQAQMRLEKKNILVNRNVVASDTSVQHPSAIRLGTYWVTMRGMGEDDMKVLAQIIAKTLKK